MANTVDFNTGQRITFNDPTAARAGSDTYLPFSPASLAASGMQVSQFFDAGAAPRPAPYEWRAQTKAGTLPLLLGNSAEIYLITSDGVLTDGNIASGNATINAASGSDKRRNLFHIGSLAADSPGSTDLYISSGFVYIYARYFGVAIFNNLGQALSSDVNAHQVTFTPVPDQVQGS